jgi:hypothetical protein
MTVDLNTCVPGQKLMSSQGSILTYVRKLPPGSYYEHEVAYPNDSKGTRMSDGFTYKNENKRLPSDQDIVEILPLDM